MSKPANIKLKQIFLAVALGLSANSYANTIDNTQLTVEELRIEKALKSMPSVAPRLSTRVDKFSTQLAPVTNYTVITLLI